MQTSVLMTLIRVEFHHINVAKTCSFCVIDYISQYLSFLVSNMCVPPVLVSFWCLHFNSY